MPKVSLIIPAHNEESYIEACLESVIRNCAGLHEIIVVDNASTDNTSEIARRYKAVRIVQETRRGITFARQRGFEEATGEILAYMDADARPPTDWICIAKDSFKQCPDLICLSGPYRYYDGPKVKRWTLDLVSKTILPIGNWLFGYMLIGGNFLVTKQAIADAGGFDRTIDFFGEDTDIGRRLSSLGTMLYRRDFFVWSSARRFYADGIVRTNLTYLINFLWVIFFHRPFSKSHRDVRAVFV